MLRVYVVLFTCVAMEMELGLENYTWLNRTTLYYDQNPPSSSADCDRYNCRVMDILILNCNISKVSSRGQFYSMAHSWSARWYGR